MRSDYSTLSIPRRVPEWELVYRSVAPLLKVIMAVCGHPRITVPEPRLHFPFRAEPGQRRGSPLAVGDGLTPLRRPEPTPKYNGHGCVRPRMVRVCRLIN